MKRVFDLSVVCGITFFDGLIRKRTYPVLIRAAVHWHAIRAPRRNCSSFTRLLSSDKFIFSPGRTDRTSIASLSSKSNRPSKNIDLHGARLGIRGQFIDSSIGLTQPAGNRVPVSDGCRLGCRAERALRRARGPVPPGPRRDPRHGGRAGPDPSPAPCRDRLAAGGQLHHPAPRAGRGRPRREPARAVRPTDRAVGRGFQRHQCAQSPFRLHRGRAVLVVAGLARGLDRADRRRRDHRQRRLGDGTGQGRRLRHGGAPA